VFRHASIQFRLLLGSKRQLGLALRACETLPQRHGDLDPFAGGELEELSEGVWLHTAIFPRHNPSGQDQECSEGIPFILELDLPAMADPHHEHQHALVLDLVDDPVVT